MAMGDLGDVCANCGLPRYEHTHIQPFAGVAVTLCPKSLFRPLSGVKGATDGAKLRVHEGSLPPARSPEAGEPVTRGAPQLLGKWCIGQGGRKLRRSRQPRQPGHSERTETQLGDHSAEEPGAAK